MLNSTFFLLLKYFHNVGYFHILYIFHTFTHKFASKRLGLDLVIMTYHVLCTCEIISHELIVFHALVLTNRAWTLTF